MSIKAWIRALMLALVAAGGVVGGAGSAWAAVPEVCRSGDEEEDEDDEPWSPGNGVQFDLWGACAELTASLTGQQQRELRREPTGFSGLFTRRGTPARNRIVNSLTGTARLETTRQTALGELKTGSQVTWSVDDDANLGSGTVSELWVSLGGLTVGYTDSLMNFWSGDFSFQATAPSRTVGIVSLTHEFGEELSLTVAVESGPPTSRSAVDGIESVDFSNPVFSARWLYETDDLTLHLSGLVREAKFQSARLLPFLSMATSRTGWAASLGATIPVASLGEEDEFSMQATYAVDASSYLGTSQDLASLSNVLPVTGPTVGWSIVGSLHHAWSEQWKSNAFVSYLALDAELRMASPNIRTRRAGANLQFLPVENLTFTAELGYVEQDFDPNRTVGFLSGVGGRALIGYLTMEWRL